MSGIKRMKNKTHKGRVKRSIYPFYKTKLYIFRTPPRFKNVQKYLISQTKFLFPFYFHSVDLNETVLHKPVDAKEIKTRIE